MPITLDNMKEAKVIIEGVELTFAQSLTLRVAIGSMQIQLEDKEYREKLGPVGKRYQERLREVMNLIMKGCV